MSQNIVDSVHITFQNRALTLDEAIAEAKKLNQWFAELGFHPRTSADPEPGRVVAPFHIEDQEAHAVQYDRPIMNYDGLRVAFLDPRAKVVAITPFELESDDAYVGLEITNARRKRESASDDRNESGAATEKEYFLDLSMASRPTDRYWDGIARKYRSSF